MSTATPAPPRESRRPGRGNAARTPTVLQMEITECGAASLAMILNYLGLDVLLEEVRERCAVSRDGVNALKMIDAARSFGLEATGYRYRADEVTQLATPFVVFWNQNHFLVVEEFGRRRVRINDPASGHRSVSREEFGESYSGVALVFRPGPEFVPSSRRRRRRPVLEMLRLLTRSRSGLVYALIAGVSVVVPTTAAALLTSIFADQVLATGDTSWVTKVVILAALVTVLLLGLTLLQQRILLRLRTKLAIRMSAGFLWHLLRLPTRFFDARSPGGLVSRVQLNSQVAELLSGQLATASISTITMILFGVVLLVLNWMLALVAIGVAAFNLVMLITVSRARISVNQSLQQTLVRLSGYTYLGISMIDDIKATGSESDFFSRWSGTQARALNAEQRLGFLTQSLLVVPGFLTLLNTVVVLAVGGFLVINHDLELAGLIAFQILAAAFFAPIAQLVSVASQFQDARAWMQQIGDVLSQPLDALAAAPAEDLGLGDEPAPAGRPGAPALLRGPSGPPAEAQLTGHVELRGVTFGYVPNEPPLIRDLSVTLQPGDRVALVGPTGSGKSTVANLVTGLFEPWSGEILFDGRPRSEIRPEVMAASMAKVDQAILLFSGSVADNIRFWDQSIPPADVVQAAADACILDEIHDKPGGFSFQVAEGGRNFSGGQRQRLEFARALAISPAVLILDEATSALDAVTEQRIDTSLRRRGCTCLLIAHRLSTIRDCDQIIVLDQGNVVEHGTHEELIALGGLYKDLVSHG
jgi:NHLM bacteriocin system ABC transporter peptidase/ATP-binding protein